MKRFQLSQDDIKRIAGKRRLRDAYLDNVGICLRDDGYILIDIREESNSIALVKLEVVEKIEIVENIADYEYGEDEEWDEDEFEEEEDLDD